MGTAPPDGECACCRFPVDAPSKFRDLALERPLPTCMFRESGAETSLLCAGCGTLWPFGPRSADAECGRFAELRPATFIEFGPFRFTEVDLFKFAELPCWRFIEFRAPMLKELAG